MTETYQSLSAQFASQPEWQGHTSSKFREPERRHYDKNDAMNKLEGADPAFLGRKHYEPTYGAVSHEKIGLKTFPHRHNKGSTEDSATIKTKQPFEHASRPYGHLEKKHLSQDSKGEAVNNLCIKTFHPLPCNGKESVLEKNMGRKKDVDGFEDQRNMIGVRSLGDKPYKNPEYSTKFYYDGGLVPGSTHTYKTTKKPLAKPLTEQEKNKPKGKKWTDKVREDELDEEEKAVKSLFEWEQTTLKEANPKWRDPDAPEVEAPKAQDTKADPKNAKKAPAKK